MTRFGLLCIMAQRYGEDKDEVERQRLHATTFAKREEAEAEQTKLLHQNLPFRTELIKLDVLMSVCKQCGNRYPSAPTGYLHKCGQCHGGMCVPEPDKAELAFAAMREFCDRVDKGEIRSKRTYAKFKEILG